MTGYSAFSIGLMLGTIKMLGNSDIDGRVMVHLGLVVGKNPASGFGGGRTLPYGKKST